MLAAGAGTRLRPLSLTKPKALFPLLDRPVISWRIKALSEARIQTVCVNMHHHAPLLSAYLKEAETLLDVQILQFNEQPEPYGTAGALKAMAKHLDGDFVVTNSDVVSSAPVQELVELHRQQEAVATILAVPCKNDEPDLVIRDGTVVRFVDHGEHAEDGWTYGCTAVFDRELLDAIPDGASGIFESLFKPLNERPSDVAALEWTGYWQDIGTPASHLSSNLDALAKELGPVPPAAGDEPVTWNQKAYVGAAAETEGAELVNCVVGHAAVVDPGARLESCVVWDHTWVPEGSYVNCVITPAGKLQVS